MQTCQSIRQAHSRINLRKHAAHAKDRSITHRHGNITNLMYQREQRERASMLINHLPSWQHRKPLPRLWQLDTAFGNILLKLLHSAVLVHLTITSNLLDLLRQLLNLDTVLSIG